MVWLYLFCFLSLTLISSGDKLETFQASFVSPGSPYIKLASTIPEPLKELTICYWIRPHNHTSDVTMTVLSYAHPKRQDELLIGIVTDAGVFLHRQQRNKNVSPAQSRHQLHIGRWNHVCATWSSITGSTRIFIDGSFTNAFSDIAFGETVEPGGSIILGQNQEIYGGSFKSDQGLHGDISELHMWDYMLCEEIEKIYKCTMRPDGNIISWSKSRKIFYSGVQTSFVRLPCGGCQ